MRVIMVTTGFLLLWATACSQPTPAPAPKADITAEETAIRDSDARWLKAAQVRDAAGEAALFASDGVAYREHIEPLVGPAAFQAWAAKDYADNPNQNITWTTNSVEVAESADLAVQTGEYHLTGLGLKGEGEDKGRFLTVWKKVEGAWKVAYDIGSTTMPEAPAEK